MPPPVLDVASVTKYYRHFTSPGARLAHALTGGWLGSHREQAAVSDVTFSLSPGETLGVMGRNGAGKTTLLALLAGVTTPSSGTIRRPAQIGTLIALGAGFDPEATGRDNLRQWGKLLPEGRFTSAEEAWIADFTELGEALDRSVKGYSQGMQLRLGFAVATVRRPELLIIDEVMAVGDFFFRRKCHERIRQFVEQGTAAVLVSHDYTEIIQFCRSAIVLDRGNVAFAGPAPEAVNRYLHALHGQEPAGTTVASSDQDRGTAVPWPAHSEQLAERPDWVAPTAALTSLACCDGDGAQRWIFAQGEQASIFVEWTARADLAVPAVSIMLSDERGVLVHGTSSHMCALGPLATLAVGDRVRVRYDVGLGLQLGEYQLDVALSDLDPETYRQRAAFTFEALGARTRLRARVDRLGVIAVVPRQGAMPTQLTHHGLVALPATLHLGIAPRTLP